MVGKVCWSSSRGSWVGRDGRFAARKLALRIEPLEGTQLVALQMNAPVLTTGAAVASRMNMLSNAGLELMA